MNQIGIECLVSGVVFASNVEGGSFDHFDVNFGNLEVVGDVGAAEIAAPNGGVAIGPPGYGFVVPVGDETGIGVVGTRHVDAGDVPFPLVVGGVDGWEPGINSSGSHWHESAVTVTDIALFGGEEEIETDRDFCGKGGEVGGGFGGVEIEEGGGSGDFFFPERRPKAVDGFASV